MKTPTAQRAARGFTLIEMVIAMVVAGIAAAMAGFFIRNAVQSYTDALSRAEIVDAADTALRRMSRELHGALPNSVRVTGGTAIEFLPTKGGGRYRAEADCSGVSCTGKPLIADGSTSVSQFDVIGSAPTSLAAGDRIVIYNLGITGADAYNSDNWSTVTGISGNTISISAFAYPFDSPSHRFQVITTPISFVCDSGSLFRYSGYAIGAAYTTGTQQLLAQNVSACQFTYTASATTQSDGIVSMRLQLTKNGGTISLFHQVHVNNIP